MVMRKWRNIDSVRVGLNRYRLQLEFSPQWTERLPGPISAVVGHDHRGNAQVTFRTDKESKCSWGLLNEEWNYHCLQIDTKYVVFDSPEDADFLFTFTKPEDCEWGQGWFRVTMPAALKPPHTVENTPKKKKLTQKEVVAQVAKLVETSRVKTGEQLISGNRLEQYRTPPVQQQPQQRVEVPARMNIQNMDIGVLVRELNRRIDSSTDTTAAIRNGHVVLTESIE